MPGKREVVGHAGVRKQPGYCKGGTFSAPGFPTVLSTTIHHTVKVKCEEQGWESRERVACNEEGEFQPLPECSKVNDYCKGVVQEDLEGKPEFLSAVVDGPFKQLFAPARAGPSAQRPT